MTCAKSPLLITIDAPGQLQHAQDTELTPLLTPPLSRRCDEQDQKKESEVYGYVLMLTSALFFEFMSFIARLLTAYLNVPVGSMMFLRGLIQFSIALGVRLATTGTALTMPLHLLPIFCVRAILSGFSIALFYSAIRLVPLANLITIFFLDPIFTLTLSMFLLGERLSRRESCAAALCFVGIMLTCDPTFNFKEKSHLLGCGLALLSAVIGSMNDLFVKMLGKRVHFLDNTLATGIPIAIVAAGMGGWKLDGLKSNSVALGLTVVHGMCGFAGHCLYNKAYQHCRAGTGAMLRNVDIPLAYGFGMLLGEMPPALGVVGSALVVLGTVMVATDSSKTETKHDEISSSD